MKRWQIIGLIVFALVSIGGAGYLGLREAAPQEMSETSGPPTVPVTVGEVNKTITAPGELVWVNAIHLTVDAGGQVGGVNVRPGDWVRKGDVLVTLENQAQLEAAAASAMVDLLEAQHALEALSENAASTLAGAQQRLMDAQKAVDQAHNRLYNLRTPAAQLDIEVAKAETALLKDRMDRAYENYMPYKNKPEDNLVRAGLLGMYADAKAGYESAARKLNYLMSTADANTLAQAEIGLAVAEAERVSAQSHMDSLVDGIDPDEQRRAEADLAEAEARLAVAEAQLGGVTLVAPFDGVVLEVNINPGQTVQVGQAVIKLTDPYGLEVLTTVIEEDLPLVEVGQIAEIFFDAMPELIVQGRVSRIVPERVSRERPLYHVYLEFEGVLEGLVSGMTADASIVVDSRADVLRLPRSLVRAGADGSAAVLVLENDQQVKHTVQTGLRGDVYVEIIEGLQSGDLVVGQ
jgi:multidrug efflux pump subunit AcrA (membrane-fusion protein)